MTTGGRFAYAQARIQSRFGRLPTEADWHRLDGVRGLAAFLEEARTGPLREWVKPLSGQSDGHDIEVGLRALYRDHVSEVAGWFPRPWYDALWWTRWLVLIPFFDHLNRGGTLPGWIDRDHDLQRLLSETGELDPELLRRSGAGALVQTEGDAAGSWLAEWRRRWPPCRSESLRNLVALEALLGRHLTDFRQTRPESAWQLRHKLRAHLGLRFHRYLLQPAGAFVYLALVLLDLERLRAELIHRALFPAPETA